MSRIYHSLRHSFLPHCQSLYRSLGHSFHPYCQSLCRSLEQCVLLEDSFWKETVGAFFQQLLQGECQVQDWLVLRRRERFLLVNRHSGFPLLGGRFRKTGQEKGARSSAESKCRREREIEHLGAHSVINGEAGRKGGWRLIPVGEGLGVRSCSSFLLLDLWPPWLAYLRHSSCCSGCSRLASAVGFSGTRDVPSCRLTGG
jgi:hypothetical protein